MRIMPVVLMLMASLAFVLAGCSDNTSSLPGPIEQSTAPASAPTLAKGVPVAHSVTGSSLVHFSDKIGTLTIAAHLYQDGSAGGTYNWVTFRGHDVEVKYGGHGEVKFMTMYPNSPFGNAVVLCGLERDKSTLANKYLAWFVVDNGQGGSATGPDLCSEFVVSATSDVSTMTPEQIYQMFPYFYVNEMGNIDIK